RTLDDNFSGGRGLEQPARRAPCPCSATRDAMQRICYRALALLICVVMFGGLIGARALRPRPRHYPLAGVSVIGLLSQGAGQSFAISAQAVPSASDDAAPLRREELRALKKELLAELRAARADERFKAMSMAEPPAALPKPVPAMIPGNGPRMRGQLVAQTQRLDLYIGKNTFSAEQIAGLSAKFERVLRAAEDYFGTTLKHRISIGFYRAPPKRGVRGMAYTDEARVELYYRAGEDTGRAVTVAM